MPFRTPDNTNALAPIPFPSDEKKDHLAASTIEDNEAFELEQKEEGNAPHIPEFIRNLSPGERQTMEKKLVRKIDLRLLPMLVLMYIMNYLDRNNIATAKFAGKTGMLADLGMTSTQYNTCVSILFVGYILMQVPSNLILSKFGKPAQFLPTVMILWGIISGCTGAAQSYGGVVGVRFVLGFVEAAYFPGCLFFLSSWYTRKELGLRTALLYSGSLISGAFSGLISAGITEGMDGKRGLSAWRWLFIVEGAITVVIAFSAYFVLPNFPRTTSWLTEEERELAAYRLVEDAGVDDTNAEDDHGFFHGFTLAARDVKTFVLMAILTGVVSSASVTNFFPTVVATLGYDHIDTLLLTAPPYVLACITASLNAWHADRTGERYLHIVLPLCVSCVAFILAISTTSLAPRYVAMMLMPSTFYPAFVVILAWISNTLSRPASKRAASIALINCVSNLTSIYASYMYNTDFAPRYTIAMGVNLGTAVMAIAAATILRFMLVNLNKKLERGEYVPGVVSTFRFAV